jgi:hypothetical protein
LDSIVFGARGGLGQVVAVGVVHVNEVGHGVSSLGSPSVVAVGAVPGKVSHFLAVEARARWGPGTPLLVPWLVLGVDFHGASVGSTVGVVVPTLSVGPRPVEVHRDVGIVHASGGVRGVVLALGIVVGLLGALIVPVLPLVLWLGVPLPLGLEESSGSVP